MASQKPFNYIIYDDFLSEELLESIMTSYSNLGFKEIKTDLYNFLQSEELDVDN